MKKNTIFLTGILLFFFAQSFKAQESKDVQLEIEELLSQRSTIKNIERDVLKEKVNEINNRIKNEKLSSKVADSLKKEAAKFHALNIENRISIIDNKVDLLRRNNGVIIETPKQNRGRFELGLGQKNQEGERILGLFYKSKKVKKFKYDKRINSDLLVSAGANNVIGKNTKASKVISFLGWYYELGWAWRYRLNKNNNSHRLNFGFTYQRNILKGSPALFEPDFSSDGLVIDGVFFPASEDEYRLVESRISTSNLVFPFHYEIGPSKERKTSNSIRYSIKNKFRFGFGGYAGISLGLSQSQKYITINQVSLGVTRGGKRGGLEENRFLFGASSYVGFGGVLLYTKLDLSPLYVFDGEKYRNFSLGLRLDL